MACPTNYMAGNVKKFGFLKNPLSELGWHMLQKALWQKKSNDWLTEIFFSIFDFRLSIFDFRLSIFDFRFSIFSMVVDFRFRFSIFDFDFDFRFRIRFSIWLVFSMSILTFDSRFKKLPVVIYNFSDDRQSFSQWFQRFK